MCDVKAKVAPNKVKQSKKTLCRAIAIGERGLPELHSTETRAGMRERESI